VNKRARTASPRERKNRGGRSATRAFKGGGGGKGRGRGKIAEGIFYLRPEEEKEKEDSATLCRLKREEGKGEVKKFDWLEFRRPFRKKREEGGSLALSRGKKESRLVLKEKSASCAGRRRDRR